MSLEDVAKEVVVSYGKKADYHCIWEVLEKHGFRDPDNELSNRVYEIVQTAEVRVKVRNW